MAELFVASNRTYGSPRIHAGLLDEGWKISVNTVAESMRRQGLQGRKPKRPKCLTRQDKTAVKFPRPGETGLHRGSAEPQVVGSCFDNAACEAFFSTLEHEVLSRHHFATKAQAREVITAWCYEFYNTRRRHS